LRKQDPVSPSSIGVSVRPYEVIVAVTDGTKVGIARANELLLFGKRKTAQELLECGFYK
jgi:hypothetical protein